MSQDNYSKKNITVLMPVFNEKETYLRKSIESILNQSYKDFEFIIINDGSTDKNIERILNKYRNSDPRIILIHGKANIGLVKSLNLGLGKATGKYIARIDSDDIAEINRLEKQLEFMRKHPRYALCGSWSYIINEAGEIIGRKRFYTDHKEVLKKILFFNFFTHSSLFFNRSIAIENGGYNENIKKAQDYDLILKLSGKYPIANLPEFLCFHRIQANSISAKSKKTQEWYGIISRFRAIFLYGHSKFSFFKIIPSLLYFILIPICIEKIIFKFIQKN